MKKLTILFALLVIGATAQITTAQADKEKNIQLLVKLTKFLEEKPFDEKAKQYRENAFAYVAQTPDVSVVVCGGDLTKDVTKKKNKFGGELLIQYSIAMAAFKLQNPTAGENAAQLAGIESMLRSYEAMVAADPKAKFEGMDNLLAKRNGGELKTLIEKADCGKKSGK